MRKYVLLAIFVTALGFSRLYKLDRLPPSLFTDELSYAVEAKSLAVSGRGLTGWKPWSLVPFNNMYAELPPLTMLPGYWLTQDPIVAAKLMPALLSLLFPFVFAWFVFGFTRDKPTAMIGLAVSAFNPWLWQMGRLALDPLYSLFFYFLGLAILVNSKDWKMLFALPCLATGFFQYQGLKLIIVPLVIIVTLARWASLPKSLCSIKKYLLGVMLGTIILMGWYMLIKLPSEGAKSRLSDQIVFMSRTYLQENVDMERKAALPNTFNQFFINKATVTLQTTLRKYANAVNPDLLFFTGEGHVNQYAVNSHGIFYWIDGLLISLGILQLVTRQTYKRLRLPLLLLFLLAPVPAVINVLSAYTLRASFLYMLLLIPLSLGIRSLMDKRFFWLIPAVYFCSIGLFAYHYFVRFPVYAADNTNFAERLLAEYIYRNRENNQVEVYTPEPQVILETYLYYNNLIRKDNVPLEPLQASTSSYRFQNVTISTDCFNPNKSTSAVTIVAQSVKLCPSPSPAGKQLPPRFLSVSRIADGGELYRIYNDNLCNGSEQGAYLRITDDRLFNLNALSTADLCNHWLTNLSQIARGK